MSWQVRQRNMLAGCPGAAPLPYLHPPPPHTGEHQEMADGPHQNKHRTEVGAVGVFSTPAARRHRENSEQAVRCRILGLPTHTCGSERHLNGLGPQNLVVGTAGGKIKCVPLRVQISAQLNARQDLGFDLGTLKGHQWKFT